MDRYSDYSNSDGCYLDCDGCDAYRPAAIITLMDATAIVMDALSIRIGAIMILMDAIAIMTDALSILLASLIKWHLISLIKP